MRGANSSVGIYDRDYYRQERPSVSSYLPSSIVGSIIVLNVAVWLADFFTPQTGVESRWLSDHLAVHVDTLSQPWLWWQYLTAGFAHSPGQFQHILFNMLGLFFLGRDVEDLYGRREFLRLYLVMIVVSFVAWDVVNVLAHTQNAQAYGASGAITGVVILYALNFPRRTLLLFFVIPVPAWALGVLLVAWDIFIAISREGDVAVTAHFAGAAFALLYYQGRWNLTRLTNFRGPSWSLFRRKPRLRVHQPEEPKTPELTEEVDRILAKIYREGEASLTSSERKILETASREYQRKSHER